MSKTVRHAHKGLRKGFTALPNLVLLDTRLSVGARLTYALLTHYAWASDNEWPGQDGLAASMGINPKALRQHMQDLARVDLLEIHRRGQGLPNAYVVHLPDGHLAVVEGPPQNGQNARSRTDDPPALERSESTGPIKEPFEDVGGEVDKSTSPQDPPRPPQGGRARDRATYLDQLKAWVRDAFGPDHLDGRVKAIDQALRMTDARTVDELRDFLTTWFPQYATEAAA